MKIKRFEASSMSEALRMVKKEFGEEAVILSAKNTKKAGRLFGAAAGNQVVVTAAIDRTPAGRPADTDHAPEMPWVAAETGGLQTAAAPLKQGQGISRILQHFTPITRTGQKKLQPKLVRLMTESKHDAPDLPPGRCAGALTIYAQLREQGLAGALCGELADKMAGLMPEQADSEEDALSALTQIVEAEGWVAPMRLSRRPAPIIIALVGPHGVGKTTTAAKLAAHAVLHGDATAALLSLDDQRIAGAAELQRYAGIMGVPFESAADPEQLQAVWPRICDARLIIVDTPGLLPGDAAGQAALGRMLAQLPEPEVHLLIHAGVQEQVIARAIAHYAPLKINRLLPTHVDWCGQCGPLINQMQHNPWPISFMGVGPQVPDSLVLLTARHLAGMLLGRHATWNPPGEEMSVRSGRHRPETSEAGRFVANRNSDIFHERSCKSVSRISDDNVVIFKDPDEAMDQGFKPCRMCCMAHFAPKPVDRLAHTRYAGSRM